MKNKIENFLNVDEIISDRKKDLSKRGPKCLVYDYNGNVVPLDGAIIWYTKDGDYVEPRSYIPEDDKNLKEIDDNKEEEICEIILNTIYNKCVIM